MEVVGEEEGILEECRRLRRGKRTSEKVCALVVCERRGERARGTLTSG
jgi:hypothetical protein